MAPIGAARAGLGYWRMAEDRLAAGRADGPAQPPARAGLNRASIFGGGLGKQEMRVMSTASGLSFRTQVMVDRGCRCCVNAGEAGDRGLGLSPPKRISAQAHQFQRKHAN